MNHSTLQRRSLSRWLLPAVLAAWLLTLAASGLVPALTSPALADATTTEDEDAAETPDEATEQDEDGAPDQDDGSEAEISEEPAPTDGAPAAPVDDGPDRETVLTMVAIVLLGLLVLAHTRYGGADRRSS